MSERAPDVEGGTLAPDKPRKGGPLARRAAILCGEIAFRIFLVERHGEAAFTEIACAEAVRRLCGDSAPLRSRAELDHVPEAGARFRAPEAEYRQWSRM